MKLLLRHRPSPAMVVALIALVVAASGTAIAATKLVSGDSLIKVRSLSANRLRNHSITGTQLNLSKLGQVPNAAHAFVAGSSEDAVNAQDAALATNAKHATNADTLNGLGAGAFEPASHFTRSGLVTAAAGGAVPLAGFGPFTLTLKCVDNGGGSFTAQIQAASSQANSAAHGVLLPTAGTPVTILTETKSSFGETDSAADFITPAGQAYAGELATAVDYPGVAQPCLGNALLSAS